MIRASWALSLVVVCAASAALALVCGACRSSAVDAEPSSACVAFTKAPAPSLRVKLAGDPPLSEEAQRRVVTFEETIYALDADGRLGRYGHGSSEPPGVAVDGVDFALAKDGAGALRAFVARWRPDAGASRTSLELVRLASADGGRTFDPASEKILLTVVGRSTPEAVSLAFGRDGDLYVAIGDAAPAAPASLLGKVLRLDVSGDGVAIPPDNPIAPGGGLREAWAAGVREPRGLDVDPETGDVWLTDFSANDDATLIHRITHGSVEELKPILSVAAPEKRVAHGGGHVYRGRALPALAGKYVYPAPSNALVVVDRFGPSGPPQTSKLDLGNEGALARGPGAELLVVTASAGLGAVEDRGPPSAAPASLLATKCFDLEAPAGVPAGAISYDVTTPLWSDGAAKDRFVIVPKGAKLTQRGDGDLVFPVGTVAVKTFAVDGKRVETRLFVQHDLEDWVGYSYAWNEAGTDAELVIGNRVKALAGGKSWYFPSSADCSACHTPAAGYTLGLEAKQLAGHGDALARLEAKVEAPVDRGGIALVPVDAPPPATAEARARSYLHANCSTCHREGSATGTVVDLDLRVDTPLAKTGLCKEAQAGTVGLAAGARIVAPHDPASSVLVARMRALDDRRMPKLASQVVDEAGLIAVEAWIRDLSACP